ncbi:FecR family protein [Pseudobacter ginsenosidimutans]|nr:FecR family protein [Pseudobacter ginsenosidimutans]
MSKDEFIQLMEKYRNGSATSRERSRFLAMVDEYGKELEMQLDEEMMDESIPLLGDADTGELIYANIQLDTIQHRTRSRLWFMRTTWARVAAAIVLLLASFAIYYTIDKSNDKIKETVVKNEPIILPGKTGAILTLADGTQVLLDSIKNGVVDNRDGIAATMRNGALVYEGEGKTSAFNTMSTPKGRQFQLRLPDGTKAWLNAASTIRYPTDFGTDKREVEMTGEVYFEVARDTRRPFRVKVQDRAAVDVLGTHFNVNAYEQEASLNTTLLEGIVRVNDNKTQMMLKPGQQCRISEQGNQVSDADIEKVMAWKNGNFNFNGTRLREAMRQLERWYDIEVVFEGRVPDIELFGELSRDITLNGMLQVLNDFDIHARIGEERRLIITP